MPGTMCSARDRFLPRTRHRSPLPPIHLRIIAEAQFSHSLGRHRSPSGRDLDCALGVGPQQPLAVRP
jgi:hypothetical protein